MARDFSHWRASRHVIERRHHRGAEQVGYGVNASLSRPIWQGAFSANLTLQQTTYNSAVFYDPPDAARFPSSQKIRSAELGANWDSNSGRWKSIWWRLQRLERDENFNASISSDLNQTFNSDQRHQREHSARAPRAISIPGLMIEGGWKVRTTPWMAIPASYPTSAPVHCRAPIPRSTRSAAKCLPRRRGVSLRTGRWKPARASNSPPSRRKSIPARSFNFLKPRLLLSWSLAPGSQIRLAPSAWWASSISTISSRPAIFPAMASAAAISG